MTADLIANLVQVPSWACATAVATTYLTASYQNRTARQDMRATEIIFASHCRLPGLQIRFAQSKGAEFDITTRWLSSSSNLPVPLRMSGNPCHVQQAVSDDEVMAAYWQASSKLRRLFTSLDHGTAHDAIQDAFITCQPKLSAVPAKSRNAYLLTAAINNIRRQLRDNRMIDGRDPAVALESRPAAQATPQDEVAVRQTVLQALRNLTPQQQEIVLRRYYTDMTIKDIATAMQLSESSVRTQLERARRKLSRDLTLAGLGKPL